MSNIFIATAYSFTVTATPVETVDMPASYLNNIQPGDIFQSSTADSTLEVDLGAAQSVNVIAALFTNLPADATWEIRAAATQAGLATGTIIQATAAFQMDAFPRGDGRSHGLVYLSAPVSFRWWKITLTGGTVPGGKLRMGRLFIGKAFTPTYNQSYGGGYRYISTTSYAAAKSGAVIPNPGAAPREYQAKLGYLTEAEAMTELYDIQELAGDRTPVLVLPDHQNPYAQRNLMYGFISIREPVLKAAFNTFVSVIKVTETI
ncbi:hypothetical protein [Paremcibacter congregatus]|uniref:hypothetical protein n=1 Tax=Paremcibacter congregatus TaxID=2043170 RepID=UPI0030EB4D65